MKVFLRHKDLHAYGTICESVQRLQAQIKFASAREDL